MGLGGAARGRQGRLGNGEPTGVLCCAALHCAWLESRWLFRVAVHRRIPSHLPMLRMLLTLCVLRCAALPQENEQSQEGKLLPMLRMPLMLCALCCAVLQENEEYQEGKLRFAGGRGEQATYEAGDEDDKAIQRQIARREARRCVGLGVCGEARACVGCASGERHAWECVSSVGALLF